MGLPADLRIVSRFAPLVSEEQAAWTIFILSIPTHPRRRFLKKGFAFFGAAAGFTAGHNKPPRAAEGPALNASPELSEVTAPPIASQPPRDSEPPKVFDAHLHCPSDESNQVWQWYPVTKTFEEFANYLTRTGVQRGIINSVRCQLAKNPADFIGGNREVA
jgi:hypothetical protein